MSTEIGYFPLQTGVSTEVDDAQTRLRNTDVLVSVERCHERGRPFVKHFRQHEKMSASRPTVVPEARPRRGFRRERRPPGRPACRTRGPDQHDDRFGQAKARGGARMAGRIKLGGCLGGNDSHTTCRTSVLLRSGGREAPGWDGQGLKPRVPRGCCRNTDARVQDGPVN